MARPATTRPPLPPQKAASQGWQGPVAGPLERRRHRCLLTTTTTWRQRPHRARSRDRSELRAGARAHAPARCPLWDGGRGGRLAVTGWARAGPGSLVTPQDVGGAASHQTVAAEKRQEEEKKNEK